MEKLSQLDDKSYIFGTVHVVTNKLDTLLDRELSQFDMTAKQWFMSVAIDTLFTSPPTLKEVAKAMGNSHQNIKQVAVKLEQKGFLDIEKDEYDGRVTRLNLTEKSHSFWKETQTRGNEFKNEVFKDISKEETAVARKVLEKIWNNLKRIENE